MAPPGHVEEGDAIGVGLGFADYAVAFFVNVPSGVLDARVLVRPVGLVVGRQAQREVHVIRRARHHRATVARVRHVQHLQAALAFQGTKPGKVWCTPCTQKPRAVKFALRRSAQPQSGLHVCLCSASACMAAPCGLSAMKAVLSEGLLWSFQGEHFMNDHSEGTCTIPTAENTSCKAHTSN